MPALVLSLVLIALSSLQFYACLVHGLADSINKTSSPVSFNTSGLTIVAHSGASSLDPEDTMILGRRTVRTGLRRCDLAHVLQPQSLCPVGRVTVCSDNTCCPDATSVSSFDYQRSSLTWSQGLLPRLLPHLRILLLLRGLSVRRWSWSMLPGKPASKCMV